jgi:hypothetical protein
MRFITYVAFLAAFVFACAQVPSKGRIYVGEIVAVRAAVGEHFTPQKGPVPLTFITVRISDGVKPERVRLALTDVYTAARYGSVGDSISFRYSGPLPFSGELAVREINEYSIRDKNG